MTDGSSFFDPIGFQLVDMPSSSRTVLRESSEMPKEEVSSSLVTTNESMEAIEQAESWLRAMLRDEFEPPEDTSFFAFRLENGVCDVVRTAYSIDNHQIEMGQSRHVISITVSGFEGDMNSSSPVEIVEEVARRVFKRGNRINLNQIGTLRDGVYGEQNNSREEVENADWIDFIHWWKRGNSISFITLKEKRGPTMEYVSTEVDLNRDWFKGEE